MNIRKTAYLSAICLFLLVLLHPFPASSAPLDNWHVRNSVPGGYTLNAVVYGNGMFVAVGNNGTILSSSDGTNWTARASGTSNGLNGVAFGNGLFVAVGDAGTALTSPDGLNWIGQTSGVTSWLGGISYGNGIFVAGGALTSQDGVHWTVISPQGGGPIRFGDDLFLMLGLNSNFYTSHNGINWSFNPGAGHRGAFSDIVLHNGTYVLVGVNFTPGFSPAHIVERILTSSDGTNWIQTYNGGINGKMFVGITHGNDYFVAVGPSGTVYFSSDGYIWTSIATAATSGLKEVVYGNRTFVAVGYNGLIIQSDPLIETVGVPTLSDWGMILFMLLSGLAAVRSLKKQYC